MFDLIGPLLLLGIVWLFGGRFWAFMTSLLVLGFALEGTFIGELARNIWAGITAVMAMVLLFGIITGDRRGGVSGSDRGGGDDPV